MAALVHMNSLLNGKDSRWLQLEVCREFQRNKCSRPDTECKFAHPPANVEVQNGRVTACYDSIKGRCNREKPPCKYFHPPQHLKDQLLINGRNHLALKNAVMQHMGIAPGQQVLPGQVQAVNGSSTTVSPLAFSLTFGSQPVMTTNPYLTGMPTNTYSPFFGPGQLVPTLLGPDPSSVGSPLGHTVVQQACPVPQQKIPRSDRLEMEAKTLGSFYYDNLGGYPGLVPMKRPAADKSGIPVYPPGVTTYQQLMQLQQPFVPVSSSNVPPNAPYVIYTDANGQLLDTLPVCQDFNRSMCNRPTCRFVHLMEGDKVELIDQRVAVCRDHAKGACRRQQCKYYHIPIVLPPANIMATIHKTTSTTITSSTSAAAVAASSSLLSSTSPSSSMIAASSPTLMSAIITTNNENIFTTECI